MIYLSEIVVRLRIKCPSFQRRVGGTATYARTTMAGQSSDNLKVPHCFVIPVREDNVTGREEYIGDTTERRRETFATVVCVDNTINRGVAGEGVMKLSAINQLRTLQQEIEAAWRDWVPRQKFDVIQFVSGEHLAMDNHRLWHTFQWSTDYVTAPGVSDPQQEAINAIIHDVSENDGPERPGDVEEIIVTYDPSRWIEDPATVEDFFLNWPLPDPPEPSQARLDQVKEDADVVLDVKPPSPDLPDPSNIPRT